MSQKIAIISLGCPKNLVDSEQMVYSLQQAGYEMTTSIDLADAVVVNTCCFIDAAKSEAIENILELARMKEDPSTALRAIVVAGCMAQSCKEEIFAELPEVDGVVCCSALDRTVEAVREALEGKKPMIEGDLTAPPFECGRTLSNAEGYAYVKIGEGCDNRCSYCVIPSLRGPSRSRPMEYILSECRDLASKGIGELIVVAQDISKYGIDLTGKPQLVELLREMAKIEGVEWIRLHYINPDGLSDELIELIASEDKIVKYIDMPIQHISGRILADMNRHYTPEDVKEKVAKLRRIENMVIRTSLIVGFPGESEEEFEELCEFLRDTRLDKVGAFPYSPQEGTPAAEMEGQIDEEVKLERAERIEYIQEDVMYERASGLEGKTLRLICEGFDRIAEIWYGRSYAESPDIDGKIFFTDDAGVAAPGRFVNVVVDDAADGEPIGHTVE